MKQMISIIKNCRVLTNNGTRIVDLEIRDGKITSVGPPSNLPESKNVCYDAHGKIVIPGLIDCHTHLFSLAMKGTEIGLRGSRSLKEIQARIASESSRRKNDRSGQWLKGSGWDQEAISERRMPTRVDIDNSVSDHPVIMLRVCGHVAVLNTLALRKLSRVLSRFEANLVPRESSGVPTGIVREGALEACLSRIPKPSVRLLYSKFIALQDLCLSLGLTGAHCILSANWRRELSCIRKLDREGRLLIHLSVFIPISALIFVEKLDKMSFRSFCKGRNFLILGFKLYCDGSLGARTAALEESYSDDRENSGILNYSLKEIAQYATRVRKLGMILASHAIGDRAVHQVLDAYKLAGLHSGDGFRIEHCSVLGKSLLNNLKIATTCIQPMFSRSDFWIEDRIGSGETRFAYAFKTLIRNAFVIAGSDSPVESIDPLSGIKAALKNRDRNERLTLRESLALYTKNAAFSSPLTLGCGMIASGKNCDLVMLNCKSLREFDKAKVDATFVHGKLVWPLAFQKSRKHSFQSGKV